MRTRWHLSHAFTERVGLPITEYVRARRLSFAAEALAAGAPDILDLALASGYNSHEAFSRAFKSLLGVTPESVRRRRTTAGLPLLVAIDMTTADERTLPTPELKTKETMTFVGLFDRFALDTTHRIPALWQRFITSYADIKGKVDPIPVGVVGPDRRRRMLQLRLCRPGERASCAGDVDHGTERPCTAIRLVPAHRTRVDHRSTYDAIWNRVLPESGWTTPEQPGLERHHPTFNPLTGERWDHDLGTCRQGELIEIA